MSDEEQIRSTVQTYFECIYESSSEKARAAFHRSAKIAGYLEDGLHEMTFLDMLSLPKSRRQVEYLQQTIPR